ncbi:MAG: hypothetical protein FWE24_03780 [Defluviitaleaceae bacterium]|nr:hypothetical protein [Defluviitaleaceae bacterium]
MQHRVIITAEYSGSILGLGESNNERFCGGIIVPPLSLSLPYYGKAASSFAAVSKIPSAKLEDP